MKLIFPRMDIQIESIGDEYIEYIAKYGHICGPEKRTVQKALAALIDLLVSKGTIRAEAENDRNRRDPCTTTTSSRNP